MRSFGRKPQREKQSWRIPEGAELKPCRHCGALIRWGVTPMGKNVPVGQDGRLHFGDCYKLQKQQKKSSRHE